MLHGQKVASVLHSASPMSLGARQTFMWLPLNCLRSLCQNFACLPFMQSVNSTAILALVQAAASRLPTTSWDEQSTNRIWVEKGLESTRLSHSLLMPSVRLLAGGSSCFQLLSQAALLQLSALRLQRRQRLLLPLELIAAGFPCRAACRQPARVRCHFVTFSSTSGCCQYVLASTWQCPTRSWARMRDSKYDSGILSRVQPVIPHFFARSATSACRRLMSPPDRRSRSAASSCTEQ